MPRLDTYFNQPSKTAEKGSIKKMHPQNINYKKLCRSVYQYREFEEGDVEKLADLIQTDGEVLQPLLVRKAGGDTYEILAGHKRHAACRFLVEVRKLEKFAFIPCYVKDMTDVQAEFAVYSTNGYDKKSDYEIMKEIQGMERLLKEHPEEFPDAPKGRMAEKLAVITEKSKTTVQEYLTISKKLGDRGMEKFRTGELSKDSAKALAAIPEDEQERVLDKGLVKAKEIKDEIRNKAGDSEAETYDDTAEPFKINEKTEDVLSKEVKEKLVFDANRPDNAVEYENPAYIDKSQSDFIEIFGKCPYCKSKTAYPLNRYFCGNCGKSVCWSKDWLTKEQTDSLPFN